MVKNRTYILFLLRFIVVLAILPQVEAADPKQPEGRIADQDLQRRMERISALPYAGGNYLVPPKDGILVYNRELAYAGLNIYIDNHAPKAYLMDMEGKVLHHWEADLQELWPDGIPDGGVLWRRVRLFDNGDLLAIFDEGSHWLVKLDKDSNILWTYKERSCHHDLDVDENGNIYVLTMEAIAEHKKLDLSPGPILVDFITILNPQGEEIENISLLECFLNSNYDSVMINARLDCRDEGDIFHTNTLELLDGRIVDKAPMFTKGHILISMRNQDAIAIVDPEERKVTWMMWGMWKIQHEPTVLDNGNLLLFDNGGISENIKRWSKVIEFNPLTQEVVWAYRGDLDNNFYSQACGTNQRLANGNTLITDSKRGRAFEVTPENKIVWEFITPNQIIYWGKECSATLFDLIRIEPSRLSFLSRPEKD